MCNPSLLLSSLYAWLPGCNETPSRLIWLIKLTLKLTPSTNARTIAGCNGQNDLHDTYVLALQSINVRLLLPRKFPAAQI